MQPRLMTVTLVTVTTALLCGVLVHAEPQHYSSQSYSYWSDPSIHLPKLFSVDQKLGRVVVAATNNIFHLSLDLKDVSNAQSVVPSPQTIHECKFDVFKPGEECQNFHHILYFQSGPGYINISNGQVNASYEQVPKEETVLICGSNAYFPECAYRNRTNLEYLTSFGASGFCPLGADSGVTAISESGQMVAGVGLDPELTRYAMTLSTAPFSGELFLKTIDDDLLYFNNPTFVDLYEDGDFYYMFMRETPVESSQHDTFSRVARVCKNDTGRLNQVMTQKVFVTYVKARMICQSTLVSSIPYDYNVLQDTVLVNGSAANAPVSGKHLYGIFTGEINGPLGSALCFYTFDGLAEVLSGNFLVQSATSEWTEHANDPPLNCEEGRSYKFAAEMVLMKDVAPQEEGEPMFMMDATIFHKLLVDKVTALDGNDYEVFLIAASVHDDLELLKMTYIPSRKGDDKSFVIQATPLNRNGSRGTSQDVGKMELYRSDNEASVYLSTTEGLYTIPISNCTAYSDCRSCVESRDPYCAYDFTNKSCVRVLGMTGDPGMKLLQDVVEGDSTVCEAPFPATNGPDVTSTSLPGPSVVLSQPSTPTTPVENGVTATVRRAEMSSSLLPQATEPPTRPLTEPESIMDHIWTIVAAAGGLIVGMVVGLLLFAAIRNREKFLWWHYLSRRNSDGDSDGKCDECAIDFDKMPAEQNNNAKPLPPRPTTPPLTKLNPTSPHHTVKITDSPILTKYTSTSCHRRSNSSGGSFSILPADQASFHLNNVKNTVHVEESVSNSDRQRYGKNVVSRQISKDYPMPSKDTSVGYQVPTGTLVFTEP